MIEHFAYGALTPILSFVLSFVGCAAGLSCTARARLYEGRRRSLWLWLGALAIGGTGVWVMHFVAMLGFSVEGAEIRYDIPLTLLSAVIAVVVVAAGLFLVDRSQGRLRPLLVGGTTAGLGVTSMHYLGMRAMHTNVPLSYAPGLVLLSVVIGVVAASAALWLSYRVRTLALGVVAAVVMGIAVSGMHYTGMAAMRMGDGDHAAHASSQTPQGLTAGELLVPLALFLFFSTLALVVTVLLARAPGEVRADREFDAWRDRLRGSDGAEDADATSVAPAQGSSDLARRDVQDQRARRATGR
ncbi:MHYT domain-containing protein [Isoptericola jiangsuensis]|uniref:MHYT domain-containing protein n=1 Tax=Isoptericola jiangsuensis TaxID=548579 RepID=UPI003AAE5FF7